MRAITEFSEDAKHHSDEWLEYTYCYLVRFALQPDRRHSTAVTDGDWQTQFVRCPFIHSDTPYIVVTSCLDLHSPGWTPGIQTAAVKSGLIQVIIITFSRMYLERNP